MATHNKKYYWLKLHEDFFTSKRIKRLRQIAGGDCFTIIYFKMLLKALKTEGYLYFDGVMNDFAEELALDIDESADNVRLTMDYLIKVGLLEMSEDQSEGYLTYLKNCIGSETASTIRSRESRAKKKEALQCNNNMLQSNAKVLQCNTNATETLQCNTNATEMMQCNTIAALTKPVCRVEIEKEIEKEIEIEKDINISNTNVLDISSDNKNMSDSETEQPLPSIQYDQIIALWNTLTAYGITPVRIIGPTTERGRMLRARLRQYGFDSFAECVDQIKASDFLQGKNNRAWMITFDWLVHPSNYPKVLEGNYKTSHKSQDTKARNFLPSVNSYDGENFEELESKLLDN